MKMLKLVLCIAVVAVLTIGVTGCGGSDNRVLIVQLEDSKRDSYGIVLFQKALKEGGQVPITVDEIREFDPGFEQEYALSKDGSYFVQGAVINYIADHGWSLHARDFGGIVFRRAK